MERQTIPPTENKLMLLFVIRRMGAMDDQSLERFLLENGLMSYMDARLCLADLQEAGLLQPLEDETPKVYLITPAGMQTLEMFERNLPYSRRMEAERLCTIWRAKLRRERQVLAQYEPEIGGCAVRLYFVEEGIRLADVTLQVADVPAAKELCARWEENPAQLYTAILKALGQTS